MSDTLLEEERFERRLKALARQTPHQKAKHAKQLEKKECEMEIEHAKMNKIILKNRNSIIEQMEDGNWNWNPNDDPVVTL